jgi:hypothetical protein
LRKSSGLAIAAGLVSLVGVRQESSPPAERTGAIAHPEDDPGRGVPRKRSGDLAVPAVEPQELVAGECEPQPVLRTKYSGTEVGHVSVRRPVGGS